MMNKKPKTTLFMTLLCSIAALILSSLTDFLGPIQETKKQAFIKKQILQCASLDTSGTSQEILKRFNENITAMLTDNTGQILSFESANIDEKEYFKQNQSQGFYKAKLKLFYQIHTKDKKIKGYIIPIDGFGLWGPIHGYIALKKDAVTVMGLTFYDHMETPGLGAEISSNEWQNQFINKSIHPSQEPINIDAPPFSIYVLKDAQRMEQSLAHTNSSVDAITGATITSNGVQKAFAVCLKAYRPLILNLHEEYGKNQ